MSNPRKRRDRRTSRPHDRAAGARPPQIRHMMRVDEAERRGDAAGALELMEAMPAGADGSSYWRPWRVDRLLRLSVLGPSLPGWVTSRWLLEQALQDLDRARRRQHLEALSLAIEIRGGVGAVAHPPGEDARLKVMDHDWAFRQCLAYELGGLAHFVRGRADADLVAAADRVQEWSRAPMGGYRFVRRGPATVTWEDLATGEDLETANIGSAAMLVPGEHAIGRLVPVEGGRMFETVPLLVTERVARAVADDPPGWLDALRGARDAGDPPRTGGVRFGFVTDVPRAISMLTTYDVPRSGVAGGVRAREVLRTAARAFAGDVPDGPEEVDVWPCLAAELLAPDVLAGLNEVMTPADAGLLARLADTLAEPAAAVCRGLAAEAQRAA